jgi:PAS domain S-box-containing protein
MSDSPKGDGETPETAWSLPIAVWQGEIADAKERVSRLRISQGVEVESVGATDQTLSELALTFEELSVAEEELRAQNEELQRTQIAMFTENARHRELFEHAPVAYFVTDAAGVIRDANRAASSLLRCRADRLLNKPLLVFAQDASRRRLRQLLLRLSKDARETPMTTVPVNLISRAGKIMRTEANIATSVDTQGRLVELRWLIVDQTRRLRRERLRRATAKELEQLVAERTSQLEREQELKDQLVATVSHEFRTALSAIGGYAELLELGVRGPLGASQLSDVRRIQRAYQHLSSVVDDLLSYSRLVAGRMPLDVQDIPLTETMHGIADLVRPQAEAKNITLEADAAREDVSIHADGERVRQIVLNMLGNAVKFTPPGGHVCISEKADDRHVHVLVSDTGPGIPEGEAENIFEPFVRLEKASPGTGLGLAISRDLARAMHGDLYVAKTQQTGSCFILSLPRSTALANPATEQG